MNEFGTLFCGDMVCAILQDRKNQTRRLPTWHNSFVDGCRNKKLFASLDWTSPDIYVDDGPSPAGNIGPYLHVPHKTDGTVHRVYPQWQKNDRLWVKETACIAPKRFATPDDSCVKDKDGEPRYIQYRATCPDEDGMRGYKLKWTPSIFMPRWASRINLTVKNIRVERVQEITPTDAVAEGYSENNGLFKPALEVLTVAQVWYSQLWDSINDKKKGCDWKSNPFVFVIDFKKE